MITLLILRNQPIETRNSEDQVKTLSTSQYMNKKQKRESFSFQGRATNDKLVKAMLEGISGEFHRDFTEKLDFGESIKDFLVV